MNDTVETKSRRKFLQELASGAALSVGAASLPSQALGIEPQFRSSPQENVAPEHGPAGFKYFIGIVGSPSVPDISWSDDELAKIIALGVNVLQLNLAWDGRPANEVLNLEDFDAEQRGKFAFRIKQAKKFGLGTIAQFGVPKVLSLDPVRPACIMDPVVRDRYALLLSEFMRSFPEVNDVMIYTYDQQAWICSEFGPCPRCSGLPLGERLPGFINLLNETMQKQRVGTTLWWKPWELSKGQTIEILNKVVPAHFGLVLNPSSSSEVYPLNERSFKSDLGVKRLVQIASGRDIPVIGEFDHTLYKPMYKIADYFPRLVYEQLAGWKEMKGVIGVKEYFGFSPTEFSINAAMLKAWMNSPEASLEQLLKEVASPYGAVAASTMIQAWEYVAQSVEAFPWDVTYLIGEMGLGQGDGGHDWEPISIPSATWDTPSWKSSRRGNFMLTGDYKADPWLFEDAGLRLEDSASLSFQAVTCFDKAISLGASQISDIRMQREFVWNAARSLQDKSLHFQETLAAHDARMIQYDPKQFGLVIERLDRLLVKDVENQRGNATVAQKLLEFRKNPKEWLNSNLNPRHEPVCAIDWSKWVTTRERTE